MGGIGNESVKVLSVKVLSSKYQSSKKQVSIEVKSLEYRFKHFKSQFCQSLRYKCQDSLGASVHVPAAPLTIQLSVGGLEEQQKMAQGLGTLPPCGRLGRIFWVQISSAPAISTLGK